MALNTDMNLFLTDTFLLNLLPCHHTVSTGIPMPYIPPIDSVPCTILGVADILANHVCIVGNPNEFISSVWAILVANTISIWREPVDCLRYILIISRVCAVEHRFAFTYMAEYFSSLHSRVLVSLFQNSFNFFQ
jgi:hypothetical protein